MTDNALKIIKDELARIDEDESEMDWSGITNNIEVLTKALSIAVSKLDEIDKALRVPAAEYVPAISDAFTIIDSSYSSIANILSGGKPRDYTSQRDGK